LLRFKVLFKVLINKNHNNFLFILKMSIFIQNLPERNVDFN